jgi:ATP-dependent RNA helicase DHX37/DHR1
MEALHRSDILVLCGETGSGKTTQVPQFLLEAGYALPASQIAAAHVAAGATMDSEPIEHPAPLYLGFPGLIAVTQPRRVAATAMAARVGAEIASGMRGTGAGERALAGTALPSAIVGYQVRHDASTISDRTRIKFMTDGVLLREIQSDLLLRAYSVIVIDEAHERNINTDVLVGLLSRALPLRNRMAREQAAALRKRLAEGALLPPADLTDAPLPPLKLIIMSATLRIEDFTANAALFARPPPVVRVEARQFPVVIHFAKRTSTDGDFVGEALAKAAKVHARLPAGGLLLFVTGADEIEFACEQLRKRYGNRKAAAATAADEAARDANEAAANATNAARVAGKQEAEITAAADAARSESLEKSRRRAASGGGGPVHVLPLYALLPAAQQARVFAPPPADHRLIVVATNVAETSITIPGIRCV